MRFRHLQHYIMAVMLGSALLLSVIFSVIAYHLIQRQAQDESVELIQNLITVVNATASAAVFSGNEMLGRDAINGLLSNDAVYSAKLVGFADDVNQGMTLSGVNEAGGSALTTITVALKSPFDEQSLGKLTVQSNADWVQRNAMDDAFYMILSLIIVIFSACLLTVQLLKSLISKPLVDVVEQLQRIKPGGDESLILPHHLKTNEIGLLVAEFNTMLDRIKQAMKLERHLRQDMETVQLSLEKAKQVAEHATLAKSTFLATMSHEIRTPMNSILGFLELALEATELSTVTRRHLQIAQTSAKFLLQLINDILDVSKIESGKLELEKHPFDLGELLLEIHELMELKAHEKGLELNLRHPQKLAPGYNSDSYRLRQILINLISNAIKFTAHGKVDIVVKRVAKQTYEFSIIDTGIGIAADSIDQILKPFTQADASITRQFGGTGLGTTISSELVQLLGGELQIESVQGEGSRFYFTIVLESAPETAVMNKTPSKAVSSIQPSKQLNILLVDDVMENITLAKIWLEKAGHTVVGAENGVAAVEATLAHPFDVILMDIQMPEMNGYEATQAIRQQTVHDGYNQTVPIVAMTASAMKEVMGEVLAAGMDEYVIKPINFATLFEVINKVTQTDAVEGVVVDSVENSVEDSVENSIDNKDEADLLPLIDFAAGLASWMDETAFNRSLNNFLLQNQQTVTELNAAIVAMDSDRVDGIIHKIKGAAGNLRLKRLYDCICQHEKQLLPLPSPEQAKAIVDLMMAILIDTLAVIDAAATNGVADAAVVPVAPEKTTECKACFVAILDACERHDPDAAEAALVDLEVFLSDDKLTAINHKLQQFDFDSALIMLAQLADDLACASTQED